MAEGLKVGGTPAKAQGRHYYRKAPPHRPRQQYSVANLVE